MNASSCNHDQDRTLYAGLAASPDATNTGWESLFDSDGQPVRVVAAPKTMDNDVHITDVTFGFRTTVNNAVEII